MNTLAEALVVRLVDFYVAATLLLLVAGVVICLLRQPAQRLAVATAAMVGLAMLVVLCPLPGWPRIAWRTTTPAEVAAAPTDFAMPAEPLPLPEMRPMARPVSMTPLPDEEAAVAETPVPE
ncbi:MAG: hypothetical protein JW888_08490, partial [Pirellulales bacterium]|nr:hypothetical protein [Pirellulales bacterium]